MENEHYFTESPSSDVKLHKLKANLRNFPFVFTTSSGVFSPLRIDMGTKLLIQHARIPKQGKILDVGTGYGVIGIVLATICPKCQITMIDINDRAIWLAKENLKRNEITNAIVHKSNFFDSVKETDFSMIISNPPLKLGHKTIMKFISESYKRIKDQGSCIQIVIRKDHVRLISYIEEVFADVEVLSSKKGYKVLWAQKL